MGIFKTIAGLLKRQYEAAEGGRLNRDFMASTTSEDAELAMSLTTLRNRSRKMIRDNPHAANLKRIVQDKIVGNGIGVQAQVMKADGTPDDELNSRIEEAWLQWSGRDNCHTAGMLSMNAMLRLVVGSVFQDGEVLVRKVHSAFGSSRIPFALEILEADLLLDQAEGTFITRWGNSVRFGVEVDQWLRPVAYWINPVHPGDSAFPSQNRRAERKRLPAAEVDHIYLVERWPQTRGIPWMHSVIRRLHDASEYTKSELVAARTAANLTGFVQMMPEMMDDPSFKNKKINLTFKSEPGTFRRLLPGETFAGYPPARNNAGLEAFMRHMLREMAAGVGVSYESLSRDYSQSNYSSSRLSLLDERSLWRILQGWLIREHLAPIYKQWLDAAVLSGAIDIPDYFRRRSFYQKVRFKPRGWSWVDPAKEVQAYISAVAAGFMSRSDVIAQIGNGQDREDVDKEIRADIDRAKELGLEFDHQIASKVQVETDEETETQKQRAGQ